MRRATWHHQYQYKHQAQFQSTLSVRRATYLPFFITLIARFQSTLSVRRATRKFPYPTNRLQISIHALREESDWITIRFSERLSYFNPRSPWGERRLTDAKSLIKSIFQSTLSVRRATIWANCINCKVEIFQSTLSVRRATLLYKLCQRQNPLFQSTLSVRRATYSLTEREVYIKLFQSTLSVRRATLRCFKYDL